jgi:predicted DNA binding CopG/RHH family protein
MEHKRTGRPSKGDRDRLPVRLPKAFAEAAKNHAARRGLTFNDYVMELLAADMGVPADQQEGLPLTA